jgi:predicted acyltransferase
MSNEEEGRAYNRGLWNGIGYSIVGFVLAEMFRSSWLLALSAYVLYLAGVGTFYCWRSTKGVSTRRAIRPKD